MHKPSDFIHWKYWLLNEWLEWNPYRLARKIGHFLDNFWNYREILWHDQDFDYGYLLDMIELKLKRMGNHFSKHGITVDSRRVARECRVASELCRRINVNDYMNGEITRESVIKDGERREADLDYLTHLIQRKLLCWWD